VLREITMAAPTTPDSALDQLPWQAQGECEVVTDGTCLYMRTRESRGSRISGMVFGVAVALSAGGYGGWLLSKDPEATAKAFGCLMLLVGALFAYVVWYSARRGPWTIVYDRGGPSAPGEIRYDGGRLPVERVRCLSTRASGGSLVMPRLVVVAELHDGTHMALGPSGVSTWPAHYGQQAATWMGLPFRHSRD
jgi:hypothetical protein